MFSMLRFLFTCYGTKGKTINNLHVVLCYLSVDHTLYVHAFSDLRIQPFVQLETYKSAKMICPKIARC